jgi:hypothetical protein
MKAKFFLNLGRSTGIVMGAGYALSASAGTPSFAAQQTFSTGSYPYAMATGDLNGDGKPDLVTTSDGDGTVSVLLNTTPANASSPTYATQAVFYVGGYPESVKIADVNGDGLPDIITANSGDGTITVLLNTTAPGATTPSFAAPQVIPVGNDPESVMVLDVNGDGKPDLAVANYGDDSITVLVNATPADATAVDFSNQQTYVMDSGYPFKLAIADMNGDGMPDILAVSDGDGGVIVMLNTTPQGALTSSFASEQEFTDGMGDSVSISVMDMNGDGVPDVVVADPMNNDVQVLINTTAAGASAVSFAPPQTFAVGNGPQSAKTVDLDGDGMGDIVTGNTNDNTLSVLLNTTIPGSLTLSFSAQPVLPTGSYPQSVTAVDVNGDGKPDLIVTNEDDMSVSVILNTTP